MKVVTTGGRDYTDVKTIWDTLDRLRVTMIACGDCRGADVLVQGYAKARGIPLVVYYADWESDGRAAGPLRNARMIEDFQPQLVVAFPGGRGTWNCARHAQRQNVQVLFVNARLRSDNYED
jgi:hypothetical protein